MTADLELIKRLEKDIGEKVKEIGLHQIMLRAKNGYAINRNKEIIGLNLSLIPFIHPPVCLSKFIHLEKLNLHSTQITNISFLQELSNIITLDLSNNNITDISDLKELSNLVELSLDDNQITDISSLRGLGNLRKLNLRNNQITDISCLLKLKNLMALDLAKNKISKLPEDIVRIAMKIDIESKYALGEGMTLYENPLGTPPQEIVKQGKKVIRMYFKSLKEDENIQLNEVKVLLVGDGGTGKTSLMKRLLGKAFNKNESSTHGININLWKVQRGKDIIRANLWDFGGQEIMHATHQFFLSKRSLYILVLDGRRDEKTEYWLKHIESFGGDSPVLVVLNKIDENPSFEVNRKFLRRKYKNIREFYSVSCKTKKGISSFVSALKIALSQVNILKTAWALNWFNVKNRLEKMEKEFISYTEYKEICVAEGIKDKTSQDTLVDFLNNLGVVIHFKDFELKDIYILNPRWITEAVYKIIYSMDLIKNKGMLDLRLLNRILKKRKKKDFYYPMDKHRYIIKLMEKFELCYKLDSENVLVPDLLKVEESEFDFDYTAALEFIIEYDFLPRSIMPRFIVNMHRDIKDRLHWRTGVVLGDKDFESTAVIKADNDAKRIYIYVNGGQKRDYFAVILAALRSINQSFEKLETRELVPMPDNPKITANYKQLIRFEEEGIEYYLPGETKKKYKVKDLLGTIGEKIEEDETLQMLRTIKMTQMQREPGKKDR